jgi:hypothetical protein
VEEERAGDEVRVYLDARGIVPRYESETAWVDAILAEAAILHPAPAYLGLAGGKFAAQVAAQTTPDQAPCQIVNVPDAAFLAPLPIGYLPLSEEAQRRLRLLGLRTIGAFAAADEVIIPVSVSLFAMKGLAQLQETITRVRESLDRPELRIRGILPTLYDHTKMAQEVVRTLYEHFPNLVFRTVIPKNVKVEEVYSHQASLYAYAPHSKGALAYERFVEEVIGHA